MKKNIKLIVFLVGLFWAGRAFAEWDPYALGTFGLPSASIYSIVENFLYWLLGIFGIVGIIGFIISGILYLTAAGNETQAEKAKKAMTYSIIGIIVGLSGLVVIFAIDWALSGYSFF